MKALGALVWKWPKEGPVGQLGNAQVIALVDEEEEEDALRPE